MPRYAEVSGAAGAALLGPGACQPPERAMKAYASEIKYSHLEDLRCVLTASSGFEVDDATTTFERQVQNDLAQARQAHLNDELGLAIRKYSELQALILKTAHPTLPVQVVHHPLWEVAYEVSAVAQFVAGAAESAGRARPPVSTVPAGVFWPEPPEPKALVTRPELMAAGAASGLDVVRDLVSTAAGAVVAGDFRGATRAYTHAIEAAGDSDLTLTAYLRQDLGLVLERAGDAQTAQKHLQVAGDLFEKA